ncbi:MAG: hypothetical protein KAU21_15505, partial [Gammaproteobacteria bacterium]|nr:hypothetical protein [Gammaproteobacteria bacterium]
MIKFLNENKDDLVCFGRNYIKQSVKKKTYKAMIFTFLFREMRDKEKNLKIDFNAVGIVDGKP